MRHSTFLSGFGEKGDIMAIYSPKSVRRNIAKLEASHTGAHERIKEFLPPIVEKMTWGSNEVILDHGYNSGKKAFEILAPIAEKYESTVYVLDNCPHTIEYAETNYPHAKINHMHGDLSIPPGTLGDLKFNKIFSLYGLYFTHDYKRALKSMYEHLLPGGEAFFIIPTKGILYDLDRQLVNHPEWQVHAEDIFTVPDYAHDGEDHQEKLKDKLVETGFEIKEYDEHFVSFTFKDIKEVADFCISMNPFLLLLPKDKRQEMEEFYYNFFLETKTETYTPGIDSPDKEYEFTYDCVHVFAKKPE